MGRKLNTGAESAASDEKKKKTGSTKAEMDESLSQKGAMNLAKRLEHYWWERGHTSARFWAEPIGERFEKVGTYEIYKVVSNLVNGLPPRYL